MGAELKLVSTYGWFGGPPENIKADIKSVSTYGWFWDVLVIVAEIKLPTVLTVELATTLAVRCD